MVYNNNNNKYEKSYLRGLLEKSKESESENTMSTSSSKPRNGDGADSE